MKDQLPYYQTHTFLTTLGGIEFPVVSKPGLPHWNEVTPAVHLLSEAVHLDRNRSVLLIGCGHGALGVALAQQNGGSGLQLVDPNLIALRVAKETLTINGFPHISVNPLTYPLPINTFATILIDLPKGRKVARRWLCEACEALQQDGELYIAGANGEGIKSVAQDAEDLFGNATVLAFRKGNRVVRMVKKKQQNMDLSTLIPAWVNLPGVQRGSWLEFHANVCGEAFKIKSLPGIFSFNEVDEGTALLLAHITRQDTNGQRVLDFGCGYGLIGMVAARLGAAWVDLLDVNLMAVAATGKNLLCNKIQNARVLPSDGVDAVANEHYDMILSNPPFHTGKDVSYDITHTMIASARQILTRNGRLVLVANRFVRYDRLMKDIFGNVRLLAESRKFHVLESVHRYASRN